MGRDSTPLANWRPRVYINPVIFRVLLSMVCLLAPAMAQLRTPATKPDPGVPTEPDATAIGALNLLPKEAATHVARIEGPDGRPFPERWYVLVHDAAAPRGLREFVFSGGKLVTGRTLSQFADSVSADEVIPASAVKINNDQAAGVAAQFAMANEKQLGSIRYELSKSHPPGVPAWRLTCTSPDGQPMGSIVLHATKGTLLGFQGFEKSPIPVDSTGAEPVAATNPPAGEKPNKPSGESTTSPKRTARTDTPARAVPVRRQPTPPPKQGPIDKIGSTFRKIFR